MATQSVGSLVQLELFSQWRYYADVILELTAAGDADISDNIIYYVISCFIIDKLVSSLGSVKTSIKSPLQF